MYDIKGHREATPRTHQQLLLDLVGPVKVSPSPGVAALVQQGHHCRHSLCRHGHRVVRRPLVVRAAHHQGAVVVAAARRPLAVDGRARVCGPLLALVVEVHPELHLQGVSALVRFGEVHLGPRRAPLRQQPFDFRHRGRAQSGRVPLAAVVGVLLLAQLLARLQVAAPGLRHVVHVNLTEREKERERVGYVCAKGRYEGKKEESRSSGVLSRRQRLGLALEKTQAWNGFVRTP
jgi:hypothetical protein